MCHPLLKSVDELVQTYECLKMACFHSQRANISQGYKYSGSDSVLFVAWVRDNSQGATHYIGQKLENELGTYDMSGNVYEWCWDWDDNYPETLQINPTGPEIDNRRVTRGGSWISSIRSARVANRDPERPDRELFYLGLRVSRNNLKNATDLYACNSRKDSQIKPSSFWGKGQGHDHSFFRSGT